MTLSCPPRQGCIRQIMHCRENKLYQLSSALQYLRISKKKKLLIFYSCVTPFFTERIHGQHPRTHKMWLIWEWEVGAPWCDARDSPAAEEKDKHPKWPGPRDPQLPMPRKWQGNVDTPPSRKATQRYCTKEEHHLSTPLPQHHVSSCC